MKELNRRIETAGVGEGWYELQRYATNDDFEVIKVGLCCLRLSLYPCPFSPTLSHSPIVPFSLVLLYGNVYGHTILSLYSYVYGHQHT